MHLIELLVQLIMYMEIKQHKKKEEKHILFFKMKTIQMAENSDLQWK